MLQRIALIVSPVCVACKSLPLSSSAATQPAITQPDLRGRLAIFSDDSMLGRDALNAGHDRAVRYLTAEVEKMGLEPAGRTAATARHSTLVNDDSIPRHGSWWVIAFFAPSWISKSFYSDAAIRDPL